MKHYLHRVVAGLVAASLFLAFAQASPIHGPHYSSGSKDLVGRVNRALSLTMDQKAQVDPIVERHEEKIHSIEMTPVPKGEKAKVLRAEYAALVQELTPLLKPAQLSELNDLIEDIQRPGLHADIAVTYGAFIPFGSDARSIFGKYQGGFDVGFGGEQEIGKTTRFGFGFDSLLANSGGNKLLVLAPQGTFEYRVHVRRHIYLFGILAAGPDYMDYSFDGPTGEHFAAKCVGLDGGLEVGMEWGPVRFGAQYRAFTEPAGLNIDGIDFFVGVTVLRF